MLLALISSLSAIFCTSEISFVIMMAFALVWLCLAGQVRKALLFALIYGVLYGLSLLMMGITPLSTLWLFANIARHLLIPISFLVGITDRPTGTLLAVFSKLHAPKSLGIATSVLLRFIPTIHTEFSFIRNSLKFRGIGLSVGQTLAMLPRMFEYLLVPLLIRTARISEELSAAAIVRGVRLDNAIVSIEPVHFGKSDIVLSIVFGSAIIATAILDVAGILG